MTARGLAPDLRQQGTHLHAAPVLVAPPGRYGWERILAGARFLGHLDPGWWREGAMLPASLTRLDMADPYRCVLAWWAAQHLPAPRRGPRQVPPYDRAILALRLSSRQAQALGFTGADADLLTSGWRHLITCLRARCPRGHCFNGPIQSLAWDNNQAQSARAQRGGHAHSARP